MTSNSISIPLSWYRDPTYPDLIFTPNGRGFSFDDLPYLLTPSVASDPQFTSPLSALPREPIVLKPGYIPVRDHEGRATSFQRPLRPDKETAPTPPAVVDLDANLNKLCELVCIWLDDEQQKAFLQLFDTLQQDQTDAANQVYLGLRRAPAAKANHHNCEGGLVLHLLEMWDAHVRFSSVFPEIMVAPYITNARVLTAILCHDLHKAWYCYRLVSTTPWVTDYSKHETEQLMTKDVKTFYLLMQHGVRLDPEQWNALCCAEGGFSSIRPYWTSVLAKYCYLLDEISGNVLERVRKGTLLDHKTLIPNFLMLKD